MKQLLILSGKGGTGKTTAAAAFIRFSEARAAADCDVDAPNLHLIFGAGEPESTPFFGSDKAFIDPALCVGCGICEEHCRFGAIRREDGKCKVTPYFCEGCGVCTYVCPQKAVTLQPDPAGTLSLYRKEDRCFSTAQLKMGCGNSGKLVTEVKKSMKKSAGAAPFAVIDGSPGIGCPVIASVTGVDFVLIVAEPSCSGISDLKRVLHTADVLHASCAVCVNKYDASPQKTAEIEAFCAREQIPFVGRIPYDKTAARAANAGKSIADYDCPARRALMDIYRRTAELMEVPVQP